MEMKRDLQLDIFRALAMIYIPCVIHTSYWMNLGSEPMLSLILFEMPVVFFISGASLSLRPMKSLRHTLKSRFRRILLPYYAYFTFYLLCVGLIAAVCAHSESFATLLTDKYELPPSIDAVSVIRGYLLPGMQGYNYFQAYHLWFIIPCFALLVSFPLQTRLVDRLRGWYIAANILLLIAVRLADAPGLVVELVGYNVFLTAGYLYYRRLSTRRIFVAMLLCASLLVVLLVTHYEFVSMQSHKFPPDLLFVVFGLTAICALSMLFSRVKLKSNKVLDTWNRHGYTLYLYQNFVIFAVFVVLKSVPALNILPTWVKFLISAAAVFSALTLIASPLSRLERKFITLFTSPFRLVKRNSVAE